MNNKHKLNAQLIKELLAKEHRKQTWLMAQMGISRSLVDKMLQGRVPGEEKLDQLAALLKCKKKELLLPRKRVAA